MTYNQQFGVKDGAAESLNVEWLAKATELGADYVVFVYENGASYAITPEKFKDIGVERTTTSGERTVSVPMHALQNVEGMML